MSRTKSMLAVAVAALLTGAAAQAAIVPSFVQVPVDAGAATDDATLNNYNVYDLQVTLTGGEKWTSGDVRAQLSSGQFYIPPALDGNTGINPVADVGAPFRYLKDDTFVTAPNFQGSRVTVLGASTFSPNPTGGATFPVSGGDRSLVDAAWGDVQGVAAVYPDGTYTIARLVATKDAVGTVQVRVGSNLNVATGNFTIPVPEPTSLALMGLGLGAIALRRRAR